MELKLAELAELSGVPARTIRLYITQGLLPRPLRAGRDAAYGEEHLARLAEIRAWQREGQSLEEIRRRLSGEKTPVVAAPVTWVSYQIAPDVMVMVRGDASPWRLKSIHAAMGRMAEGVNHDNNT